MKRKQVLWLLLCMIMASAAWGQTKTEVVNGLLYSYNSESTEVAVQSFTSDWNGIVPAKVTIGGVERTVTAIYAHAFKYYEGVKITINAPLATGDSRYAIGERTFAYCPNLTKVTFPSTMGEWFYTIPGSAFEGCASLESVNLPATITDIKPFAFYDCKALNDLGPNGLKNVKYLRERAFGNCNGLDGTTISLPNLVFAVERPFSFVKNLTIDLRENEGIPACDQSFYGYKTLVRKGTGRYYRQLWKTQYDPTKIVDELDSEIKPGVQLWDINGDNVLNLPDAQRIIDEILGK